MFSCPPSSLPLKADPKTGDLIPTTQANTLFQCLRCDTNEQALVTAESVDFKGPFTFTFVPSNSRKFKPQNIVLHVLIVENINITGTYQTGHVVCRFDPSARAFPCKTEGGEPQNQRK